MSIPTIAAILIETVRPRELAEFYSLGLGLAKPQPSGESHIGFDIDGVYLGFERVEAAKSIQHGPVSVWFYIDDIKTVFGRFQQANAAIIENPTLRPNGETLAILSDPDGNIFGLIQKKD
jgi:predicted enzyme related to lactoylglutathione lyase